MNILVHASIFSEEFSESSPEGRMFIQAHPECSWRFRSIKDCTAEDLAWAEVIYGMPDPASLKEAKNLRWLHLMTAGVNNYADPGLFSDPTPILTRSAGVHAATMAEHAIGLALAVGRKFPLLYSHQKEHDWHYEMAGSELFDSTVILLGTGYLASDLIKRLKGFGCRIIGVRRDCAKPAPEGVEKIYPVEKLLEVLAEADYLFNTLPLTPETHHLLGAEAFRSAKPGMILINMGRGGTVDTPALVEALREGRLGGAGLDVTEPEPLDRDNPLWDMSNVVISPHCSAVSKTTNTRRNAMFLHQLELFLSGKPLEGVVDFAAGY